jgi:hypothetical protein
MLVKDFCRALDVSVMIVAHPTKAVLEHGGRDATLADVEGSMNWFNKADNGLILIRNHDKNITAVRSAKVREAGSGRTGQYEFYVDRLSGLFTPKLGSLSYEYR